MKANEAISAINNTGLSEDDKKILVAMVRRMEIDLTTLSAMDDEAWRDTIPAGKAGAAGAGATVSSSQLIAKAECVLGALTEVQRIEVLDSPSTEFRTLRRQLREGSFNAIERTKWLARLKRVLSSTTRFQFTAETNLVFGEKIGSSQAGVEIRFVLDGPRVVCGKVGPRSIRDEHELSKKIHSDWVCPTVLKSERVVTVPRKASPGCADVAVIMPYFPMSVDDAVVTLCDGRGVEQSRRALTRSIAICGLASVQAFSHVGYAHGDIKPGNMMLDATGIVTLIDFGTAKPLESESFEEASIYNLNTERKPSVHYDLICLGSTLAYVSGIFITGKSTVSELVTRLKADETKDEPGCKLALACVTGKELAVVVHMARTLFPDDDSAVTFANVWPTSRGGGH